VQWCHRIAQVVCESKQCLYLTNKVCGKFWEFLEKGNLRPLLAFHPPIDGPLGRGVKVAFDADDQSGFHQFAAPGGNPVNWPTKVFRYLAVIAHAQFSDRKKNNLPAIIFSVGVFFVRGKACLVIVCHRMGLEVV
jgi:hypothetical protein